jgi:hypothetical protein
MRTFSLIAFALLASCATLDTGAMTPVCRDIYNACLNGCRRDSPATIGDNSVPPGGGARRDGDPVGTNWGDSTTPGCVSGCNERGKRCK